MGRRSRQHSLAAIEASEPHRGFFGIADRDDDAIHGSAKLLCYDLGNHRLGALSHRNRAGGNFDHTRRADFHFDLLIGTATGRLYKVSKPDAEIAASLARFSLAAWKIRPACA